jgi:triosephosphate isomerase
MLMRRPIIAGNWKMNKTVPEAVRLAKQIKLLVEEDARERVEVVLCPPFTALHAVGEVLQDSAVKLGAQNVHDQPKGAYTGEVSVPMLKDLGCEYVILGHSERRAYFGETDEMVNRKAKAALSRDLGVIICVGETLHEKREGRTEEVVRTQVRGALAGLEPARPEQLVIAYEPVWAIGTGENATGSEANDVIAMIRRLVGELLGADTAEAVRIQYGGSVKPENIKSFLTQSDIDGALVGGASLEAASFAEIVKG